MKRYCLFFVVFFAVCQLSLAQNSTSDSLKNELKIAESDSQRVNILNEISYNLFQTNPDEAISYGEQAKELATEINFQKGLAYANKNIGLGYYMQGDYIQVLANWEKSLEAFEAMGDKVGVANINSNIGAVYFNFGDDALALEYYLKSLKSSEELQDEFRIYSALVNIGTLYLNKEETHDKALEYFQKALPYLTHVNDKSSEGNLYTNLGELYMEQTEYDTAIYYLDKALAAFEGTAFYPHSLSVKGKVFLNKGETGQAVALQQEAVQLSRDIGQKLVLAESLIGLGESYLAQQRYSTAIEVLKEAQDVATEVGSNYHLKDAYLFLSKAYAQTNSFQDAYRFKELYSMMKDTIYNIETNDKIKGLQFTYQMDKKQDEINLLAAANEIQQLETKRQRAISWGAGTVGVLLLILVIGVFRRYKFMKKIKAILETEKDRSDNLLLNILPAETAEELKEKGEAEPKYYDSASIIFTDFKGFTSISANMTPRELVNDLHECFKMFDLIISRYGVEKIKTIGDAYMAAGGIPIESEDHAIKVTKAALEIRSYMDKHKKSREEQGRPFFEVRIGIHTGPVVAGIVGIKKFAYDIWGDTVNVAARMESNSEPGRINVSELTYNLIKDEFDCEYRGEIEAKNRGKLKMYFVNSHKDGELDAVDESDYQPANIKYVS